MYGSWLALKKSWLFNLLSFMPLPIFTESAEILISRTPEVTSVDGKVSVASHWLNLPSMATEAFTKNLTSLSSGVMVKTGPWAWANDGNSADARRQKTVNRTEPLLESKRHKRSRLRLSYHSRPSDPIC